MKKRLKITLYGERSSDKKRVYIVDKELLNLDFDSLLHVKKRSKPTSMKDFDPAVMNVSYTTH